MKRVWIAEGEVTGSMVSTWNQSWGLSRNERTGRWILYDRRESWEEGEHHLNTWKEYFDSTDLLAEHMMAFDDPEQMVASVTGEPALLELADAIRKRAR